MFKKSWVLETDLSSHFHCILTFSIFIFSFSVSDTMVHYIITFLQRISASLLFPCPWYLPVKTLPLEKPKPLTFMPIPMKHAREKSPNQAQVLTLNDQKLQMRTQDLQELYNIYLVNLMFHLLILFPNIFSFLNLREIIRC